MKAEKIVISFIAVAIGILVAGGAFYLYQQTKTIPETTKATTISKTSKPIATPTPEVFLNVEKPKDEEVFDSKTITISGKTDPNATILITTDINDQIIEPARNGNFSTTQTIEDGQNRIEITAISQTGEEISVIRTVTFSTEAF